MSISLRTIISAAVGGLVVAVAALSVRPTPVLGAPTNDPTGAAPHTITVTSSGTSTVTPDVAHVALGINVSKQTVEAARSEAARVMRAIVDAAKAKGVAEKDIRTTNISLSPQYTDGCAYQPSSSVCPKAAAVIGYTMSEQVEVIVRDLDKAGELIDAATAAGANDLGGIWFGVDDPAKAEADARIAAIHAAHDKAAAMAQAAGVSLGAVVSIAEASVGIPYPVPMAAGARDSASTPVQPGTQDVQATVTIVYEIG